MNEKSPYEEIQEISNLYTPGCEAWIDEIREMAERHGLPEDEIENYITQLETANLAFQAIAEHEDEVILQIGTLLMTLINLYLIHI